MVKGTESADPCGEADRLEALRHMLKFFFSLRLAIWLLLALLCLFFYGAVVMPLREEFQALHVLPLFRWMMDNPGSITWWLWASVGVISLLTANTLFCSIESLIKKKSVRQWMLIISPQIVHIGFLFILLAHLLSGYGSFKGTAAVPENTGIRLPGGEEVLVRKIHADADPRGYLRDWSADIEYFSEGRSVKTARIRPNSPSVRHGLGIYIKTVQFRPYPVAVLEASREPGAAWALIGGMLFMAGMTTLLLFKVKREGEQQGSRG